MLQVTNLIKTFKDAVAVDNISFEVEPGKIFGLLGPNGAGKTTTIRMILNIIKPSSGTILFEGKPFNKEFFNIAGYLPEERGLYKKSKVLDTILYFASLKNMGKKAAVERSLEWLGKLEIEDCKNKKIEELSKGNQQKVQFIASIVHDPLLIILDEPFSGFDPIIQQTIKEIMLSFVNSGKIIILSTHQMDNAEKLCSDIFLINKGKEVCSGSLPQLKKHFASNNVRVEFEGNATAIESNPLVEHADCYSGYAEVKLLDNVLPHDFLKSIIDKITIQQFSVIEPTLDQIFINAIKESLH